jgi:hypothetical protein
MFGYVIANSAELSEQEKLRYRQVYCGLCQQLGTLHGQLSRISLTYDMTFLILLLSSFYEPEEVTETRRCIMHPVKSTARTVSRITDYAADMSIVLTYYKCRDDWQDDKSLPKYLYSGILEKHFEEACMRWPRQAKAVREGIAQLSQIEKQNGSMEEASRCFGRLMAELFVYGNDAWDDAFRRFGDYLGRFLYLMDAATDYDADKKKGRYNPFVASEKTEEERRDILVMLIGKATAIFEQMPFVQDDHLIRNILYSGVWQRYNAKFHANGKEQADG